MLLVLQNQLIEHIEIQRRGRAFGPAQGAGVRLLRQRLDGLGQRLRGMLQPGGVHTHGLVAHGTLQHPAGIV